MIHFVFISDGWVTAISTGILAILTIFLAIYAFLTYSESRKVFRQERFENKFYELLKLHKANVDELEIAGHIHGRKCFVPMFYELRFCYQVAEDCLTSIEPKIRQELKMDEINLMKLAYHIFFFGLKANSENQLYYACKPSDSMLFERVRKQLQQVQDQYGAYPKMTPEVVYDCTLDPLGSGQSKFSTELYYFPFDGHMNILGHYYRHLYQSAKFIISQSFLTCEEKYAYIKTLRAQFSNFEQLLLYYNSFAGFEDEWKELFTTYRLIKNLPIPLADFYRRPLEYFSKEIAELAAKGKRMFQWDAQLV
jgi:hypothetical protein